MPPEDRCAVLPFSGDPEMPAAVAVTVQATLSLATPLADMQPAGWLASTSWCLPANLQVACLPEAWQG